jgi:rhomboid protease GluP
LLTKHHKLPRALVISMRSSMVFFLGYSLVMGVVSDHIDNAAHVGGLIAGFAMAAVMAERFDWDEYRRAGRLRAAIAVGGAALALALVWSLVPR